MSIAKEELPRILKKIIEEGRIREVCYTEFYFDESEDELFLAREACSWCEQPLKTHQMITRLFKPPDESLAWLCPNCVGLWFNGLKKLGMKLTHQRVHIEYGGRKG